MMIKEFKAEVDAYNAETKRIAAVQAGMTEQQIQDIAMGVVAAAMESNELVAPSEAREMQMPPEMPMPEQGEMNEMR